MTFSDKRIIEAASKTFTPVWESVAPASVAEFDLGDGKKVRGTVGGEIALYFCRPDGMVFDCLPALQSPAITLAAIKRAATFYASSKGAPIEAILAYNAERRDAIAKEQGITSKKAADVVAAAHEKLKKRLAMGGPADRIMITALLSKSAIGLGSGAPESVTVVEPGGLWLYAIQVHDLLSKNGLRTPQELKTFVFEGILDQKLEGGVQRFSSLSVLPMSVEESEFEK